MYDLFSIGERVASLPTNQIAMIVLLIFYLTRKKLNWHNKQGIGYPTALYLSDMALLSSIECYVSSGEILMQSNMSHQKKYNVK